MRHLRATRLLSRLVLATCSAAAFAALNVSLCQAQDEPTAIATDAPDAEPQPWQPQLAELPEQLASLRQELDELKSRPTPDAELEIKRLDEKIDLLQSLLSKPDAPSKADLDSLRDFLSLQDEIVEQRGRLERKIIEERINAYTWAVVAIVLVLGFLITRFGMKFFELWMAKSFTSLTEKELSEFRTKLNEIERQALSKVARLDSYVKKVAKDSKTLISDQVFPKEELKEEITRTTQAIVENKEPAKYTANDWYVLGTDAFFGERYEEALADYTKAIEIKPDFADAYNNRGVILGKLERNEEALADYTKAIEIRPDDADNYYNRGNTLDKLDRYAEALADYAKAIELQPNDAYAYNNRGVTLFNLERYEEALADYMKAIEMKPDEARAYQNAAENCIVADKPDAALEFLDSATPYVQEAEDQAIHAWLTCIATTLLEKDTTAADAEFAATMKEVFKSTFSTDVIERWLKKAELDEEVRAYIREKTEQFKAH